MTIEMHYTTLPPYKLKYLVQPISSSTDQVLHLFRPSARLFIAAYSTY